jgi:hypothetical protein
MLSRSMVQATIADVDAPAFRIWPPVAVGVPLGAGLVLTAGLALITPSTWGPLSLPVGVAALRWGAIGPEERYLAAKFGADDDAYRARVRRWL